MQNGTASALPLLKQTIVDLFGRNLQFWKLIETTGNPLGLLRTVWFQMGLPCIAMAIFHPKIDPYEGKNGSN